MNIKKITLSEKEINRILKDADFWTLLIAFVAFFVSLLPDNSPPIEYVTATFFDANPFFHKYMIIEELENRIGKVLQALGGFATIYFAVRNKNRLESRFKNAFVCFLLGIIISLPVRWVVNKVCTEIYMPKLLKPMLPTIKKHIDVLKKDSKNQQSIDDLKLDCILFDLDCQPDITTDVLIKKFEDLYEENGFKI